MRYMVYRWESPYLDYPLEVSISWIYLLSPYNWFCRFCTSHHLVPLSCSGLYSYNTVLNACIWFKFIDAHVLVLARHLAFITPLVREFLTSLDLHVQILKFKPWWTPWWSEWCIRNIVDQRKTSPGLYPFRPPARPSSFSFVTHEGILYYSS